MVHSSPSHRRRNHLILAVLSFTFLGLLVAFSNSPVIDVLSIASAYLCLLLLATALSLGPLQAVLLGTRSTNNYVRRDIGIWAASTGMVHLIVATKLAMTTTYIDTYVALSLDGLSEHVRTTLFLWGSITAYAIGILLILLFVLSNDRILKWLGVKWWKRLQRSAYLAFILTIIHGFIFQLLESRNLVLVSLLLIVFLLVLIMQSIGFIAVRNKKLD